MSTMFGILNGAPCVSSFDVLVVINAARTLAEPEKIWSALEINKRETSNNAYIILKVAPCINVFYSSAAMKIARTLAKAERKHRASLRDMREKRHR
jgi:hypothetical protein